MLRNAVGVSAFPEKSVTNVSGSTLLALRGGWVGVKFPGKKRYEQLTCFVPGAGCARHPSGH